MFNTAPEEKFYSISEAAALLDMTAAELRKRANKRRMSDLRAAYLLADWKDAANLA